MQTYNKIRKVSIAHSPDADDVFMYYAIYFGWVGNKHDRFTNTQLDIETLNIQALKSTYDISAISFALYPHIAKDYALLRTATSFGNGYGPKLVKKKGTKLKKNFKVALSGANTTNAMLFKIKYPEAKIKYYNFLDIENAVINSEVDAGVLIHESILTFDSSLEVEVEVWDIWLDLVKSELPLPLGGMAIRRSLVLLKAIEYEEILTKAVAVAYKNKSLLSKMLYDLNLIRVDATKLDKYLNMYANEESIILSENQINAIDKLYEIGFEHGFYANKISTNDYLLPTEYKELRFS